MVNNTFLEKFYSFDKRTIARAISIIEANGDDAVTLLKQVYHKTGNAYRIGITGPPGAGKSTLVNLLTKHYTENGRKTGVIAVDPTSPFTGGALLGDRVRMSSIGNNSNVFIRSMATRGSLGGLSKKAVDAGDILDAAGYDIVIFETVGVGQSELDIANAADTTIVVLVPESGDSVQAMKAGLMEIADLFVLNKSDRPGSEQAVTALKTILMMKNHDINSWLPSITKTVASENKGITEVAGEIEKHRLYLVEKGLFEKKRHAREKLRIKEIVEEKLKAHLWQTHDVSEFNSSMDEGQQEKLSPYHIAEQIIVSFKNRL